MLFKSFLFENRKYIIRYVMIFTGLPVLFHLLNLIHVSIGTSELLLFIAAFYLMIVPAQVLAPLNHKIKGISFYMMPASIVEKTISILLYLNIIVPLILLISTICGDLLGRFIIIHTKDFYFNYSLLYAFIHNSGHCFTFGFFFTCFISLFILGGVYFKKGGFAKTILFIFAIVLITAFIFNTIWHLKNGNTQININIPHTISYIVYFLLFPCACWAGTYLTLKKRQL